MAGHYDALETRDPAAREREQFAALPDILARAMTASGWARHLKGFDPKSVTSWAALAKLPVLRKSDLAGLQKDDPPFGGFNVIAPGKGRRLQMSPGPIFEPEGQGKDFGNCARALFAAGFRAGDVVHNSFSYHLTPGAYIMEEGAFALACAVIPGGVGNTEQQLEAIAHYKPSGYVGTPDFVKILLDTADKSGKDASSIKRGLVSGAALPASLRDGLGKRGVALLQCYAVAELGVIAYESEAREGMIVNEEVILEIVRPGTDDPAAPGDVGEVVVTSFNPDYPMIRLATGDLSALLPGRSPCGRTNARIKGWMGRADQTAKVKGMFVHPRQIAELGGRHPQLARLRLIVGREGEQDTMTLMAESATRDDALAAAVAETLQSVTKLKGAIKLVAVGELPNDGKVIADERKINPGAVPTPGGRIGVLLVNLGTPDATDYWSMRRYLKEFLSDRRVVETNRFIWWLALNLVILTLRPGRKGPDYDKIWNKERNESPLKTITRAQSDKLEEMFDKVDKRIRVDWAMRYGNPSIRSRLEALVAQDCERILVVPLYPQYAAATTATVCDEAFRALARMRFQPTVRVAAPYYAEPVYIDALASSLNAELAKLKFKPEVIVASYGMPEEYVAKGDPYYRHCAETTALLRKKLKLDDEQLVMTFQSRFGKAEWLKPYTDATLKSLAERGVKSLAVITPGFAADCLETLEEIAMENAEIFRHAGGKNFAAIPCLNDSVPGMAVIRDVTLRELKGWV